MFGKIMVLGRKRRLLELQLCPDDMAHFPILRTAKVNRCLEIRGRMSASSARIYLRFQEKRLELTSFQCHLTLTPRIVQFSFKW
jgi:hypothetical protein